MKWQICRLKLNLVLNWLAFFLLVSFIFFTLKNSFNILHERQKVAKGRIDSLESELSELKEILTILKTQHESKHCDTSKGFKL